MLFFSLNLWLILLFFFFGHLFNFLLEELDRLILSKISLSSLFFYQRVFVRILSFGCSSSVLEWLSSVVRWFLMIRFLFFVLSFSCVCISNLPFWVILEFPRASFPFTEVFVRRSFLGNYQESKYYRKYFLILIFSNFLVPLKSVF